MGYVIRAFFRSFLIQSSWNFERMQSLGFFYSIFPALKALHKEEGELKKASGRHLEFFNTNPYMASAIIGATIRLEENGASDEDIKALKAGLMGPYGAVGDSLFWGSLRPLAAVAGASLALNRSLWAPLVFLFIYNVPHLFIRFYGIMAGYKAGAGVVNIIKKLGIPYKVQGIKRGVLFITGFLFSIVLYTAKESFSYGISFMAIVALIGFYWGLGRGVKVEVLAISAVAVSVVFGLFM